MVNLPAVAEESDELGREVGDALWADRYPKSRLDEIKRVLTTEKGALWWEALYQQRPSLPDGGLFKRENMRHWRRDVLNKRYDVYSFGYGASTRHVPKPGLVRFGIVDLAASLRETADWFVMSSWGLIPGTRTLILIDLERVRTDNYEPYIRRQVEEHNLGGVGVESAGMQLGIVKHLMRTGLPIRELKADKDKFSRALPASAWHEAGNLIFPAHAPWRAVFERCSSARMTWVICMSWSSTTLARW